MLISHCVLGDGNWRIVSNQHVLCACMNTGNVIPAHHCRLLWPHRVCCWPHHNVSTHTGVVKKTSQALHAENFGFWRWTDMIGKAKRGEKRCPAQPRWQGGSGYPNILLGTGNRAYIIHPHSWIMQTNSCLVNTWLLHRRTGTLQRVFPREYKYSRIFLVVFTMFCEVVFGKSKTMKMAFVTVFGQFLPNLNQVRPQNSDLRGYFAAEENEF